jgi:hypothetical protein
MRIRVCRQTQHSAATRSVVHRYSGRMEFSRLPRFERASAVPAMQLTKRDHEILRLVHDHRFLRSPHICALVTGSTQQVLRRLKLLYHHAYLERPRAQLRYYHQGGSQHIVYAVGKKGAALLKDLGLASDQTTWSVKSRCPGRVFLEHALLVSDVMVAIELDCRQKGIRLVPQTELATENKQSTRPISVASCCKWKGATQCHTRSCLCFGVQERERRDRPCDFLS